MAGNAFSDVLRSLESLFNRDFGHVRIHTGSRAARFASERNAEAFTVGRNIVFGANAFDPSSAHGLWLLAHELTHVIQQCRDFPSRSDCSYSLRRLEQIANEAADLVVAGHRLASDFIFGEAPAGLIQCHDGPSCPGVAIEAGDSLIWGPANEAIEIAYREDPKTGGKANAVFFGSQFETGRDVLPPDGVPNRRYAEILLRQLRGLVNQRRPDIIDFRDRQFYEIKTVRYVKSGQTQVESYYAIADEVRREYAPNEPPWKIDYANWYPPHVLPFPTDPLRKIVCTQNTNHNLYPAIILYDVRQIGDEEERKQQRMKVVVQHQLTDFDRNFSEFAPRVQSELRLKVPKYDPEAPDYVVIVGERFYREWQRVVSDRLLEKMAVKLPPYLDKRTPIGQFHSIGWTMVGLTAAAMAAVQTFALFAAAGAIAGGAAAGTAGGGAAGGTVISLAAFRAVASAAKPVAQAAGVLIVLGVGTARAQNVVVEDVSAMRAVPIADFQPRGALQVAYSPQNQAGNMEGGICRDPTNKFNMNERVMFDDQPHYIIGKFVAK